jgi:Uma2 family endonuclease
MSAALITPLVTIEDFLARPPRTDGQVEELVEGVVYVSPNTKPMHNLVTQRMQKALRVLEPLGYEIFGEWAIRANDNSLPNTDACVLSPEQIARYEENPEEFPRDSPVLVVEVLSPGNKRKQIDDKVRLYLAGGADEVWVVNPKLRTVFVHLNELDIHEVREDETLSFLGASIVIADLFPKKRK